MPAPKVKYSELEDAFLFGHESSFSWLDRKTGEILFYTEDAVAAVESGDIDNLPNWLRDEVDSARKVLQAFGELPSLRLVNDRNEDEQNRYVSIEQIPSNEVFRFMSDFVDQLKSSQARFALTRALRGNKPFRKFKDSLYDFPNESKQWFAYEAQRRREYIEEWAADQQVELDFSK
jgi:Uncharacterised protein family (UPF0158)